MSSEAILAITDSRPPATDYLTYLTILESHLSPAILPTLNNILQDAQLTQNIGWDLVHLLLPLPGSQPCLTTIARLGNPREVVLKVTEALQLLQWDDEDEEIALTEDEKKTGRSKSAPTAIERFSTLTSLLAILLPRIKTKYPSRFLSTSLMALLRAFQPSNQATLAVIAFIHSISGKKRPPLPGRKSSTHIAVSNIPAGGTAPDPEAQEEDPKESAIQQKLLQSFITHVLEEYVNSNPLEWAARLQEHFDPGKVVTNQASSRVSWAELFKENPDLEMRETIVGQLVALARDLKLYEYDVLIAEIYKNETQSSDEDPEDNYPTTPEAVPLSRGGSLFLIAAFIFSSTLFESMLPLPKLRIFPDLANLVANFIGVGGPASVGSEELGVIDAILAIGIWLEAENQFVGGPLEDEEFLQLLQGLSLVSANNSSPSLRYAAHNLTSSILHAHPIDQVRLAFIRDTLEHCPYEALKACAVSWLKEEITSANERRSENAFSSTVALAAVQPYLFPDTTALSDAADDELLEELGQSFPFHMAVVNFLYFVGSEKYNHISPSLMFTVAEQIYLGPLKSALERSIKVSDSQLDSKEQQVELQLLSHRIALCSAQIEAR